MPHRAEDVLAVLHRNLQSIWDSDVDVYRETTAEDVSFFEWFITPQRIDGLDFHLREVGAHGLASDGATPASQARIEHEILQPRVQVYGDTAVVTYTLLVRTITADAVRRLSHNETRVFHDFGSPGAPQWKLVHCHKSPIATSTHLHILR